MRPASGRIPGLVTRLAGCVGCAGAPFPVRSASRGTIEKGHIPRRPDWRRSGQLQFRSGVTTNMKRCFLIATHDFDSARLAAQLRPQDSVLPLSLNAVVKLSDWRPRALSLNDLVSHERMSELAREAQSVQRRFLEASCQGDLIDGIYWPGLFDEYNKILYFRDLLLAEEIARTLIPQGFDQVVWLGTTNSEPHVPFHAFWAGLSSILGPKLTRSPRRRKLDRRSLQAVGSKIQARLRRIHRLALPRQQVTKQCKVVSIFATTEGDAAQWRFTNALLDLYRVYGDRVQMWYLGRVTGKLARWASSHGTTAVSVPYPQSVDPDINSFFARNWRRWQDGAAKDLAEATGHPVIAEDNLQSHFHQFFTYTLPRTVQWARELERLLRMADPDLVVGSAAFTYETALPYHVSRKLGIPSVALSHTYAPGDIAPIASDYLACRNRFERLGYKRSFPSEQRVIYCKNSSNRISYVPTPHNGLKKGDRPVVAILTAYPGADSVVTPLVDIDAFWSTLKSIASPPGEFSDLHFVFKSHPRFDVGPLLRGRISRPNVEIFGALGSVIDLLNEAWVIVICNHYGSVVVDSIATGLPILFLNSARLFYPSFESLGEAGAPVSGMLDFWETLRRLKTSANFYSEIAARSRDFRAKYLEGTERGLTEQLTELAETSDIARMAGGSAATNHLAAPVR
jgi:hypothetical protein